MRAWIQLMIRHRRIVLVGFLIFTCWLALQITKLEIIIDPDNVFPQSHRFLRVGNEIEKIFGNKFTAVVGLSPRSGSIYQKDFLNKVKSVSDKISQTPGVVPGALLLLKGLAAKEIAEARDASVKTIGQQCSAVYEKSKLGNRAELAAYFLEDLFLPPEPPKDKSLNLNTALGK